MKMTSFSLFLLLLLISILDAEEQKDDFVPEQIHISFGEKTNNIVVTWCTKKAVKSTIKYGVKGQIITEAKAKSTVFVDGGEKKRKQWIHRAALKKLEFDSIYEYAVGNQYNWSETFQFKTMPSGVESPVRALIYGDLGVDFDYSLPALLQDSKSGNYDLIIHAGDIAYNMDDDEGKVGDRFMNLVQPLATRLPYMVCPGNHEVGYNYSHYKNRFSMPAPNFADNMFYSFNVGPIHFVSLNTEAYYNNSRYPATDPNTNVSMVLQYQWLIKDLIEANRPENRKLRPWIITFGHRPFYCSNSLPADQCFTKDYPHRVGIKKLGGMALEPVLMKYGIDLAIWAHEHSYERMWPVYKKKVYNGSYDKPYVNPRAPVHITTGSAGSREGTDKFSDNLPSYSAFRSSHFGYTRFICYNKTHLYMEQISTHEPSRSRLASTNKTLASTNKTLASTNKTLASINKTSASANNTSASANNTSASSNVIDSFWIVKKI